MKTCLTMVALVVVALVYGLLAQAESSSPAADVMLVNGKIWTVNSTKPEAEALAVWRDRIVAVGKTAEVLTWKGPDTRVVDLQGRRVVPGFYDSHVHFLGSGLRYGEVALKDAANEEEFGRLLRDFDRKMPRDRWML